MILHTPLSIIAAPVVCGAVSWAGAGCFSLFAASSSFALKSGPSLGVALSGWVDDILAAV